MTLAEKAPYQCLNATEAAALIRSEPQLRLFDARDLQSYRQQHLEGAVHLAEERIGLLLNRLPKDVPVLIYCYHGNASKTFAQTFADFRFSRVYSADGGYRPLYNALEGLQAGSA
jgi:rhodanese-related sulfurtransferase